MSRLLVPGMGLVWAVLLLLLPGVGQTVEWYDRAQSEPIGVTRLQWNVLRLQDDALGYFKEDGVTPYVTLDTSQQMIRVELDHHPSILGLEGEELTARFQEEVELIHALVSHLFPAINVFYDVTVEFWSRDPHDPRVSLDLGEYANGELRLEER